MKIIYGILGVLLIYNQAFALQSSYSEGDCRALFPEIIKIAFDPHLPDQNSDIEKVKLTPDQEYLSDVSALTRTSLTNFCRSENKNRTINGLSTEFDSACSHNCQTQGIGLSGSIHNTCAQICRETTAKINRYISCYKIEIEKYSGKIEGPSKCKLEEDKDKQLETAQNPNDSFEKTCPPVVTSNRDSLNKKTPQDVGAAAAPAPEPVPAKEQ